ncbi:hypothetical protein [Schleiferilactobacillus harbinensis]|uniref:hypothetical protein n=1 Tax=Schleiferilactobacillus harbinensis TaxID=304207 RepID=UPI0039EB8B77
MTKATKLIVCGVIDVITIILLLFIPSLISLWLAFSQLSHAADLGALVVLVLTIVGTDTGLLILRHDIIKLL